jgi:hypothetical protein
VTGGAVDFDLPFGIAHAIKQGILNCARSQNAWIITGGTNVGVMKLVGDIIHSSKSQTSLPLIGVGVSSVAALMPLMLCSMPGGP